MARVRKAARAVKRGIGTLNSVRKGRKADKLRKRVVKTRAHKNAPVRSLRRDAALARHKSRRFLGVKKK